MRYGGWASIGALAMICAGVVSPARAADVVVEKIPLQYVDARYVALVLGGSVLPTEADLVLGRVGFGGYGGGMASGYGGGFLPGSGVLGDPSTNSILVRPGGGAFSGGSLYGDPNTNSLLIGPRRGNVRPRSRVYGIPGSNSLPYRR